MRVQTWLLLTVGSALCASGQEMARSCQGPGARLPCWVLFVEGGEVRKGLLGSRGGITNASRVGPYIRELQALVSPREAPVTDIVAPSGWRVVSTLGFEGVYRLAGPIHYLYLFSPDGRIQLKESADVVLERLEIGRLFDSASEFLLITNRGEVAISVMTEIWLLGGDRYMGLGRSPQLVLDVNGKIAEVRKPGPGIKPGVVIRYPIPGEGGHDDRWGIAIWEWDEADRSFRRTPPGVGAEHE